MILLSKLIVPSFDDKVMLVGDNEELVNCKIRLALVSNGTKFVMKNILNFGFTDMQEKIQQIDKNIRING